jgi:3-hydroxyacyl-CoA dehydrogenase/enoyl-CoA hydratase/3-hydroxybutyryl-CoA epimerase
MSDETRAAAAFRVESLGDGVAALLFDLPGSKVNKLSAAALMELDGQLERLGRDSSVRALIIASGKEGSSTFIAGADIEEIAAIRDAAEAREKAARAHAVFDRLDRMPMPTIAVVHGKCLGGGTELILACDFRLATDHPQTSIGLPEVLLGIIPGFGGTQRLPRLIGIQPALDIILNGKSVDARAAFKLGLVDRIAPVPLYRDAALRFAKETIAAAGGREFLPRRRRSLGQRLIEGTPPGRSLIRLLARRGVRQRTRGLYPAPLRAVEAVIDGFSKPLEDGLKLELDLVASLIAGAPSKRLIDVFQSSERLRRGPAGDGEKAASAGAAPPRTLDDAPRALGILGAGVMGGSIAALVARKGFRVRLKDIAPAALAAGLREARRSFDDLVKKRRLKPNEAENALLAIAPTMETRGFAHVEGVLEAVVEDIGIKKRVLAEIEPRLPAGAFFATNTSALSIDELAEAAARPERVAGLHFFNPVHRMPLVEVVVGARSSEETVAGLESLAREIGKYPLRVQNGPGFLVNRLLLPYLNEAGFLFEEGYRMEAIEAAALDFGLPVGPFALLDEIGFDVAAKVGKHLHEKLGERAAPSGLLQRLVEEEKLLGKKGGAGFYRYRGGKRRGPNPRVRRHGGAGALPDKPEWWIQRLLMPMVNEASRCLEEGIVREAWEVDIAMVLGTGFPPFRGGPLHWADSIGLAEVVKTLDDLAHVTGAKGGARFAPHESLKRRALAGARFHDREAVRESVANR